MSAVDDLNEILKEGYYVNGYTVNQAILELSDSIKALTDRVDVLEIDNQATQMFINEQEDKDIGPVLNDGKATSDPGGHLPFVTGLSVLDSLKK